jgi:hypothetical protein
MREHIKENTNEQLYVKDGNTAQRDRLSGHRNQLVIHIAAFQSAELAYRTQFLACTFFVEDAKILRVAPWTILPSDLIQCYFQ